MNPIFRAAANGLSRSRSEGQIRMEKQRAIQKQKRRQDKEKRRVDGLEREKKWMASEKVAGRKDDDSPHDELAAEKFQKELCWCIQQLEMGLANMKPNQKQAQEVERVLRTLKSPKAPIAKKRQVMRTTFGDYRSKMLQEEKKHAAVMANKTNICKVTPNKVNQATFFRRSTGSGLHQRSATSPAVYTPSLSPTKEEAGGGGTARGGTSIVEPAGKTETNADSGSIDASAVLSADNKFGEERDTAQCAMTAETSMQKLDDKLPGNADGESVANDESNLRNSGTSGGCPLHFQNTLASVEKASPTHSTVSTVSSDSFNPTATSSSSSSLSSRELTPSSQPHGSCQTFRFDFRIEEEEKAGGEKESGTTAKDEESAMNRKNDDNKKTTERKWENTTPLTEGGNSPVIEGVSAKEGKKKKRNRKKKKKKEADVAGKDDGKDGNKNEQVKENRKEKDSSVELSLGGGDFKFNFGDKLKET